MKNKKISGFSLLELIIIIAIVAILATISSLALVDYFARNNLERDAQKIIFTLKNARDRSINQERGLQWGVHFENPTSGQGFYELFAGTSYPGETILKNNLSAGIKFLIPAAGLSQNILFSKVTGLASASTTIVIALNNDDAVSKTINVSTGIGELGY